MAQNVDICTVDEDLKQKLKKFRFRKAKNNAAISMKIDKATRTVVLEEEYEDCTLEDLQDELPGHQPRFLAYSYVWKHDDRVSYPLCFIFISPQGCNPEQTMMYAGSRKNIQDAGEFTKVFELRSLEDLTEEWLINKLSH